MNEQISALLDGEIEDDSTDAILDAVLGEHAWRQCWRRYSLIGDALRDKVSADDRVFESVMARLEQEPTVIAPVRERRIAMKAAANESVWQRVVPVAAAVMGVAVVLWGAMAVREPALPSHLFVTQAAPALAATKAPVLAADRAYLLAHQSYAGGGTVPGVSNYLRTVADPAGAAAR